MRKLVTTILLLTNFVFANQALAQSVAPVEQENIINLQNQILQRQGQIERDVKQKQELKEIAIDKQESLRIEEDQDEEKELESEAGSVVQKYQSLRCHRIKEINFSQNKLISKSQEREFAGHYVNKCLSVEQISDLAKEITNYLTEQGYTTSRAEIPVQNLSGQALRVDIIEGYLEDIIFNENNFLDRLQRFSVFGFFKKGDLLNIRPIEAALDQINRLQSSNARIKILPGNKKNHSIILVETFSTKPLHVNLTYDNNGNDRTGSRRETVAVSYDNLLRLNDVISIQRSANDLDRKRDKDGGTNSFSTSISIPFQTYNFAANYSNSSYFFHSGSAASFKSHGETSTASMSLDKIISKSKFTKISGGLAFNHRNNRNFIGDVKLEQSSRKASFLTANYSQSFFLKNATLLLKPSYSKAINALDSRQDAGNAASTAAHAEFNIFKLYANYSRNFEYFSKKFSYNASFDLQQSSKKLYGIDQFSVGGIYSVRGFKNGSISGDSGYNIRNEISVSLNQLFQSEKLPLHRFSLTPFYDYGYVRSKGGNFSGRLSGAGAKISFYHQNFDASLTFSKPLQRSHLLNRKDLRDNDAIFFNIHSQFSL